MNSVRNAAANVMTEISNTVINENMYRVAWAHGLAIYFPSTAGSLTLITMDRSSTFPMIPNGKNSAGIL